MNNENCSMKKAIIDDISLHIDDITKKEKATVNALSFLAKYMEYYKYMFVKNKIDSGNIHSYVINDLTTKFGEFDHKEISFYLIKRGFFKTKHIMFFSICLFSLISSSTFCYLGAKPFMLSVVIGTVLTILIAGTYMESNFLSYKRYNLKSLKEILDKEQV